MAALLRAATQPSSAHLLIHLHHTIVQHVRHVDLQVEDARAALIANVQKVPESSRHEECTALAFAFKQCISGHLYSTVTGM